MKIKNILTVIVLALTALSSCEMKEEIKGGNGNASDIGYLELGVSVDTKKNSITKAVADPTNPIINVDQYPVVIKGVSNTEFIKEYSNYIAFKEAMPIELPVGSYMIFAHSAGEMLPVMEEPFYGGETPLLITKGVTSSARVICKMKNTKISLRYTDRFTSSMKTWSITIHDNTQNILSFTHDSLDVKPKYLAMSEKASEIIVNIEGVKADGTKVSEYRSITKPEGAASSYWGANDDLTITMDMSEAGVVTGVSGIKVTVNVNFEEFEESWDIPVGGETNPVPPVAPEGGGNKPTITSDYLKDGISYQLSADGSVMTGNPSEALVKIAVPGKLAKLIVKIIAGNDTFHSMLIPLGLNEGRDLLSLSSSSSSEMDGILVEVLSPLPKKGDSSYNLDIAKFFTMMNGAGGGTSALGHRFEITVTDMAGQTATATLAVIINQEGK